VLGVLLISCVAGVVAHIPAGLGVLEAVFLALLHGQLGQGTLWPRYWAIERCTT
jgi:uncharacterized membrane protein YbhN (UPF0104 family)